MSSEGKGMSAMQLALAMGDKLPRLADLPGGALELAAAARELAAAITATDVDDAERREIAGQLRAVTARLRKKQRDPLIVLARNEQGMIENLTQAGWGRWNPQSLGIAFDSTLLSYPEPGSEPQRIELTATCTLSEAHSGPPGRAHGGVVMTMLDEALGTGAVISGAGGMTAGLNVRFKGATPLGVPLELRSRYERSEGRKRFMTGEVVADGVVTAQAEGVFIAPNQG